MNELQQTIIEATSGLPEKAKIYFSDKSWLSVVEKIGQKYSLDIEETNILKDEVMYTMLGLYENPKVLFEELKNTFDKDSGIITNILKEIDEQIITPFSNLFPNQTLEGGVNYNNTTTPFDPTKVKIPLSVQEIGSKYDLNFEETARMADLIEKVTNGEKSATLFENDLISLLSIRTDRARHLTEEIDDKVFKPIRESLKVEIPKNTPSVKIDTFKQKMQGLNASEHQKETIENKTEATPTKSKDPWADPYRETIK